MYNFSNIPQTEYYITIGFLFLTSDRKAINRAKKINPNYTYIIKEQG